MGWINGLTDIALLPEKAAREEGSAASPSEGGWGRRMDQAITVREAVSAEDTAVFWTQLRAL